MFLPVAWTVFVILALISFGMIAAYWLDVQDRRDLSLRRRIGLSLAAVAFPLSIPIYVNCRKSGRKTEGRCFRRPRIINLLDCRQLTRWIQRSSKGIQNTKRLI